MSGRRSGKNRRIQIEEYRGFEVWYNEEDDKFGCEIADTSYDSGFKEMKRVSLTAIKQYIDEHIKLNEKFEPFIVLNVGGGGVPSKKKVLSKRKDNKFVYLDGDRSRFIDPDNNWEGKDYLVFNEEDQELIDKITKIHKQIEELNKEERALRKTFKSKTINKVYGTRDIRD